MGVDIMRIKIIFQKQLPIGGYEPFTNYAKRVNTEIENLEKDGVFIVDVDVREFSNEEIYTQIKYRTK